MEYRWRAKPLPNQEQVLQLAESIRVRAFDTDAAAIAALEKAVADDEAVRAQAEAEGAPPRREGHVSLRQRAWPLRDLMQRSLKYNADVVWGV